MEKQPERDMQISFKLPSGLRLGPNAIRVLEMKFANPDKTNLEIAKEVGISGPRVSAILNHPRVLEAMPQIAKGKLSGMVPKAVKRFEELMTQQANPETARKVTERVLTSKKVLDSPEMVVKHDITMKSVPELKQILSKGAELAGQDVIDAEIVDEGSDINA